MESTEGLLATTPHTSPIDILPPELLAEVFNHSTTHDTFAPVLLSHVSALWRRTAITTPRLWRSISTRIPSLNMDATTTKVRAWLNRSGSFPVHISLYVSEWSNEPHIISFFDNLREHGWHWGRFDLTATSCHIARRVVVFFTLGPHYAMLSRIDFNASPVTSDDIFDDDPFEAQDDVQDIRGDITIVFFALHDIAVHAFRLTELNITSAALPYASLGEAACPDLPHLRTLRIFEGINRFGQIEAASVLRILARCPQLETFIFRGGYIFEPRSDAVDVVNLPCLRELHLAQTFHQRIILSRLFTPQLEILRLSWLNRPERLIEDAYEPEFSEEREEPPEYSQSPHTDVLTGTGLRTLIRRSLPPLRVLDMDFADARSPKDFVWLFAHLPSLETFRIIGSDMSDKVLNALAAPSTGGGWLCPRLTHVELSRCDMITGRSVIALVKARNPPIEGKNAEEEDTYPAQLVQLKVEACASVDCESIAVKQYLMDDVDFEVEELPSLQIFPEEGIRMPE